MSSVRPLISAVGVAKVGAEVAPLEVSTCHAVQSANSTSSPLPLVCDTFHAPLPVLNCPARVSFRSSHAVSAASCVALSAAIFVEL